MPGGLKPSRQRCGIEDIRGYFEYLATEVRDIDGERQLLRVEQGKGAKDRLVPLADTLLAQVRAYWRLFRPPANGYSRVARLPRR